MILAIYIIIGIVWAVAWAIFAAVVVSHGTMEDKIASNSFLIYAFLFPLWPILLIYLAISVPLTLRKM